MESAPIHPLPDHAFIEELNRRYGGIPDELLRDRSLLELFVPTLRADIEALETYEYVAGRALSCPIWVIGGASDPWAPREELEGWRAETSGGFEVRTFPGGHFYLENAREAVLAMIVQALSESVPEMRPEQARV